jgi:nitrogen-specific signal transduction histidine kinase
MVRCDPEKLSEILHELINNAYVWRKSEQTAAEVTIKTERPNRNGVPASMRADWETGYVRIVVSDNGKGLSAEVRERLFSPHVSGSASGMGLALAWARSVLQSQRGEIIETSSAGEGARFAIFLAIAEDTGVSQ